MKIYFAGPWFTVEQRMVYCQALLQTTCKHNHDIYIPKFVKLSPLETFVSNVDNINDCDMMIALVDYKDVGTAWEIGMAYAKNKPIYLVGSTEDVFLKSKTNLMLAFTGKCILLKDIPKLLTNSLTESDYVKIPVSNWEVIE